PRRRSGGGSPGVLGGVRPHPVVLSCRHTRLILAFTTYLPQRHNPTTPYHQYPRSTHQHSPHQPTPPPLPTHLPLNTPTHHPATITRNRHHPRLTASTTPPQPHHRHSSPHIRFTGPTDRPPRSAGRSPAFLPTFFFPHLLHGAFGPTSAVVRG